MTHEILKMYGALQPQFREKLGPCVKGDRIINPFSRTQTSPYCLTSDYPDAPLNTVRLPLPIDPLNPERGLEGMILGAMIMRRTFGIREWYLTVTTENDIVTYTANTPTEALLKALMAQEKP